MESQSHLALIKFSGNDAFDFLQGQLTNDLTTANERWQFSAYCSPKGRCLALLYLWRQNQGVYALIKNDLLEATVKRLKMYVLRSKVDIEVIQDASISAFFEQESPLGSLKVESSLTSLGFGSSQLIISFGSSTHASEAQVWREQLISAGLPQLSNTTADLFVPQMLNLDLLDGISFKKGCYTGQEIVARMHYLGKLKQRLLLLELDESSGNSAKIGEKLFAEDGTNLGHLLNVLPNFNKSLAVLRHQNLDSQTSVKTDNGAIFKVAAEQPHKLEQD